jgi:hypothetical protein
MLMVAATLTQVDASGLNANPVESADKSKFFTLAREERSRGFKNYEGETDSVGNPLGHPATVSNKMMLRNNNDQWYSGPMSFGTPRQGNITTSVFIYDTTSSMTSVTSDTASHNCTTCPTNYYDSTKSSSAVQNNSTEFANFTSMDFMNGDLTVNGSVWNEVACINATDAWSCTDKEFPIFVIDSMTGPEDSIKKFGKVDGILGFGPPTGNKTHAGNNETSYILALHKAHKIAEPTMSMNLNYDDTSTSYIVIGSRPFANTGMQFVYPMDTTKYD